MQIASRQVVWNRGGKGTVIEVEMTPDTGIYLKFRCNAATETPVSIRWGDGADIAFAYTTQDIVAEHRYAAYGRYKVVFEGARSIGLRNLDGETQYSFDNAIISFVDHSGLIVGSRSGAFKRSANLERFVAPNLTGFGQRDFAYCTKLKEVVAPLSAYFYDGTFQKCRELETLELTGGTMWSYVFRGCTKLREIRFTRVDQISTQCFANCPALEDIWIPNKTIAQTRQVAPSGNIIAGYGARFPWNANASTRFHCMDGIVLGNGTVIQE